MRHSNARLTVHARWLLVRRVLERHWPAVRAAEAMGVSRATACKWVRRYREEGSRGLHDRAPVARRRPHALPAGCVKRICAARLRRRRGPHYLAHTLGIPRSTIYGVLRRAGLHRLDWIDRPTRTVVRYERARPGELVHVDVKKLGRIPDGGGKRFAPGFLETMSGPQRRRGAGFEYLHVAIDDHSRVAYVELLPDEKGPTTAAFLKRAIAHFKRLGVRIRRILTDNARNYLSCAVRAVTRAHGIAHKRTRPYRPQTNGKAEAFIKILLREWAYVRKYLTNGERVAALSAFMNYYNQHRLHGGINGATPASRL